MNTNSNVYTIVYASVMVVIVAFLLAFVSSALKPTQDANVAIDKKQQILFSMNIRDIEKSQVQDKYKEVVKKDVVYAESSTEPSKSGDKQDEDGFTVQTKELSPTCRPLYVCEVDGKTVYVVPVKGAGLWGGIWGYVSLEADLETVRGAYFNHESETAGLGAEIKDNKKWQAQFDGKKIFNGDNKSAIALSVVKKGKSVDGVGDNNKIDAVTGATLTSNGVNEMLHECLGNYIDIFDNLKK